MYSGVPTTVPVAVRPGLGASTPRASPRSRSAARVHGLERRGDRVADGAGLGGGERLGARGEPRGEGGAAEPLHREVGPAILEPPVRMEGRHVRRPDALERGGLLAKTRLGERI